MGHGVDVSGRVGLRLFPVVLAVLAAAWLAPVASATDRVYWGNGTGPPGKISFANLDGTGGGDLNTGAAPVDGPFGLAIDAAAGEIYWADYNPATTEVSFANLDGTGGGGTLNTSGASMNVETSGLAIDPAAGRLYWGGGNVPAISYAALNGSGGGDLNTAGATVSCPTGVAVEPGTGKIYWSNCGASNKISFANLNGSGGGGDLNTSGATVNDPEGVAVDVATGKIYWANRGANKISFANLDDSGGGGDLTIMGATVNQPIGIAIDPIAGRIYWANNGGNNISYANLDGSNGGTVATTGATMSYPSFPVLLRAPVAAGSPQISGGSTAGSSLSCSRGTWAPDLLGSFLYRVPGSFTYQWTFNGADIAGATSSTYPAPAAGSYTCRVTGSNQAGSATQTSAPFTVTGAGAPPPVTAHIPPALTHVSQSHRRWRRGSGLSHIASVRAPVGTTFRFTLNESARVRFVFEQLLPGRRVGGRCVAPTVSNLGKPKCTRSVPRGTLSFTVGAGAHKLRFQGRLSKHSRLAIGRYTLVITATNAAGQRATAKLTFTIVT